MIAVVDSGVRESLYDTGSGSVLANDDLVIPTSVTITLGGTAAVTVTLKTDFGDNGWANPTSIALAVESTTLTILNAGTNKYCYNPNPNLFVSWSSLPCDPDEIEIEVEAGARVFVRVLEFDTHGERVSGALKALRPEAHLLIRRIQLGVPHTEDAPFAIDMFDQLRAYNSWAKGGGGEAVRIVSNSYGRSYVTVTAPFTGRYIIDDSSIAEPSYTYSVGDFLNENRDALVVFAAGNDPTPFPERQGLIPYFLTGKGGEDDVKLCLEQFLVDFSSCPHTASFSAPTLPHNPTVYVQVPNQFIAVAGAWDRQFSPSSEVQTLEERSEFDSDFAKCGFAKQWCMTAFGWEVPVQAPPGGFPRVVEVTSSFSTAITLSAGGVNSVTVSGVGGVSLTVAQDFQKFIDGTSFAVPRVSAAAAGVMKALDAAGMTDAQMVQAILFKTAYKCTGSDSIGMLNKVAKDPITSMDRADMLPSSDKCETGFSDLDPDEVGQGLLNYRGALADAATVMVSSSRDGVLSEFKSTAFRASEAFGREVAERLAAADLELVATATGNTYRHRPPAAGLQPATSAYGDRQRIALFGAQRAQAEPAGFGLFQHRPAAWAAPEDALASGFTWRSRLAEGAFQFSYDRDLLPSRFMASATLQPEARSSPYLDFVRTGAEASYTRGPLSLAVAQGGRDDELGGSEAFVALGGYRHALGEDAVLHMGLGVLRESDRLLGAGTGGAFALDDAHTRFARFGVEWRLGKATLFATHWRGETSAPAGETAVFAGPVRARTASYAAGAVGEGVLASGDELTFTVYQPLRVYGGRMELSLPTDRNGDEQDGAVGLGADGREIGLGLGYRRPLPNGGHWSVGLLHRTEPDHRRGAASESVAAVAVGYDW